MAPAVASRTRADALPEAQIGEGYYRDTGCEVAPSCLNCPLPVCRYDRLGGSRSILNHSSRDPAIRAARAAGESIEAIMARFGIGRRTAYRVLELHDATE